MTQLPAKETFCARRPAHISLLMLLIAQLDISHGEFSTSELARLTGRTPEAITHRIRRMMPREDGRRAVHRLEFREAVLVLRAIVRDNNKLPDADLLYDRLVREGIIDQGFPLNCHAVRLAECIFEEEKRSIYIKAEREFQERQREQKRILRDYVAGQSGDKVHE